MVGVGESVGVAEGGMGVSVGVAVFVRVVVGNGVWVNGTAVDVGSAAPQPCARKRIPVAITNTIERVCILIRLFHLNC